MIASYADPAHHSFFRCANFPSPLASLNEIGMTFLKLANFWIILSSKCLLEVYGWKDGGVGIVCFPSIELLCADIYSICFNNFFIISFIVMSNSS